jgi:hypothetical protein
VPKECFQNIEFMREYWAILTLKRREVWTSDSFCYPQITQIVINSAPSVHKKREDGIALHPLEVADCLSKLN